MSTVAALTMVVIMVIRAMRAVARFDWLIAPKIEAKSPPVIRGAVPPVIVSIMVAVLPVFVMTEFFIVVLRVMVFRWLLVLAIAIAIATAIGVSVKATHKSK
ncbi:hypothetical protein KOI40_10035 [Aestuariicella sp. G3-2]|uniref:hypothetical protein n=1 Tax=Pseudomaricurvus albidus TaxID=2842452 RepID=UPI001C0C449A|nr:hypothetical protein [Aestuariicella albida]MBU3070160.1 hypothetical protein [Aestuariicella albida]